MENLISCIIVDDEHSSRDIIKEYVRREFLDILIIDGEASNLTEAIEAVNSVNPDIVFLDIELGNESGFDLYDHFPNSNFEVIFTTGYESYAVKAVRYAALDYLLKPISLTELKDCIDRVKENMKLNGSKSRLATLLNNLNASQPQTISLSSFDGFESVNINDISYISADVNYSNVVLHNTKEYYVAKTLKKFEELLPEETFFRIHKSAIVNRNFIQSSKRGEHVVMHDGKKFDIASRRKRDFQTFLINN